jgi:hypothetical protein
MLCNNVIIDIKIKFKIIIQGKDYSLVEHETVESARIFLLFHRTVQGDSRIL